MELFGVCIGASKLVSTEPKKLESKQKRISQISNTSLPAFLISWLAFILPWDRVILLVGVRHG